MDLEDVSISVILISIIVICVFGFMDGFTEHYENLTVDDSFQDSYDLIQDESDRIKQMDDTMFSYGANSAFSWIPNVGAILGIGTIIKNSVGLINQMLQDLSEYLGVSPLIITGFSAIITILFIFALLRLVIGRGRIWLMKY